MSKKTSPKKSAPAPAAQPAISPKALILLGVILVVLTITTLVYQRETPFLPNQLKTSLFNDIAPEDSSNTLVNSSLAYLGSKGIMKGYDDGSFKPDKEVTRAELAKILVMAVVKSDIPDKKIICFSDVKVEDWFGKYVCYAQEKGWVKGYPDQTFKPGNLVNQAEMMKMLVTAMDLKLINPAMLLDSVKVPPKLFSTEWYAEYAKILVAKNIITGEELNFPKLMTRKEVATLVFRALLVDTLKIDTYSEGKISDFFKVEKVAISGEPTPKPVTVEPKPKSSSKKKPSASGVIDSGVRIQIPASSNAH